MGEETAEPVFNTNVQSTPADTGPNIHHVPNQQATTEPNIHCIPQSHVPVQPSQQSLNHVNQHDTSEPHRSSRITQPLLAQSCPFSFSSDSGEGTRLG